MVDERIVLVQMHRVAHHRLALHRDLGPLAAGPALWQVPGCKSTPEKSSGVE